jgi:hypothetical protein
VSDDIESCVGNYPNDLAREPECGFRISLCSVY